MSACCNIDNFDIRTQQAVRLCIANCWPFALYCLPYENYVYFMADPDKDIPTSKGPTFFAVPFNHNYSDRITIRNVFDVEQILTYAGSKDKSFPARNFPEADRKEYINSTGLLINELKRLGGKCVISRIFRNSLSPGRLYNTIPLLFSANPGAFRALFFSPECGEWLVMSPELLADADIENKNLRTMSLAGTRPAYSHGKWDNKNIKEQRIVTETIVSDLKSLGLIPEISECRTLTSNLVEHICTDISVRMNDDTTIENILDKLSPTPAIAGFPKDKSLQQIATFETHDRMLYGGYFGINDSGRLLAHVTLRCAFISGNSVYIYVGSGITPDSDANCEWDEIMLKANQFIACFNKTTLS